MSEYKRSLDELREIYLQDALPGEVESEGQMFDEVIRAIRADVWDESMHAMAEAWGWPPERHSGPNPYRESGSGT